MCSQTHPAQRLGNRAVGTLSTHAWTVRPAIARQRSQSIGSRPPWTGAATASMRLPNPGQHPIQDRHQGQTPPTEHVNDYEERNDRRTCARMGERRRDVGGSGPCELLIGLTKTALEIVLTAESSRPTHLLP